MPAGHTRPAYVATLAADEAGEGVPLLLLHAFPLSRRMWRPQLAALAGCCRMLAPDLPGFGESPPLDSPEGAPGPDSAPAGAADAPAAPPLAAAPPGVCRMEDMAAAAVRLLDARGIPAAVVCGLSMGGYVALALYEGFPERVRGLVDRFRECGFQDARMIETSGEGAIERSTETAGAVQKMLQERSKREAVQRFLGCADRDVLDRCRTDEPPNAATRVALPRHQRPADFCDGQGRS